MSDKMLESAIKWGRLNFKVFPVAGIKEKLCSCPKGQSCQSPGKHPLIKDWQNRATTEPEAIRQFWQWYPGANIGLLTDKFIVVDIDEKNGGVESLKRIVDEFGQLERTLTVLTGSGGGSKHFFYRSRIEVSNKVNLIKGVDIRGIGGFIVAAPSLHKSGLRYKIIDSGTDKEGAIFLGETPKFILDLITKVKVPTKVVSSSSKNRMDVSGKITSGGRNNYLIQQGGLLRSNGRDEAEIQAELRRMNLDHCKPPLAEEEVMQICKSASGYANRPVKRKWEPLDLKPDLDGDRLIDLPNSIMPSIYDRFVGEHCLSSNLPHVAVAVPLVTAISAVLGAAFKIRPSSSSEHAEYLNLWGIVIAPSGSRKTTALNCAKKFVDQIDNDFLEMQEQKEKEIRASRVLLDRELQGLRKNKSLDSEDMKNLQDKTVELEGLAEHAPYWTFVTNDSTPESLGLLFRDNYRGILYFKDELDGLLQLFNKQSFETLRSIMNEGWNGGRPFKTTRVGRGFVTAKKCTISVLGGVQPDILSREFGDELKKGFSGDGMLARFQLIANYTHKDIRNAQPIHDVSTSEKEITSLFEKLHKLTKDYNTNGLFPAEDLFLSDKASKVFENFLRKNQNRLVAGDCLSEAYKSHISKYPKLAMALAGQFHIVDCIHQSKNISPEVKTDKLKLALEWVKYMDYQAVRMYSLTSKRVAEQTLSKRILNLDIYDGMTVREIYRKNWSGLYSREDVLNAAETLADSNWLHISWASPKAGGRKTEIVQLHPDFIKAAQLSSKGRGDNTDGSKGSDL